MKSTFVKCGVLLLSLTLCGAALAQTSGAQRMGNGSNGTNSNNGVSGNTTGAGNAQTTNPQNMYEQ
jgi:hypothetical protein